MIRSLRSIFSSPPPRVLLVGGDRAILYLFDGARLAYAYIFSADDNGFALFDRCLKEIGQAPLCVLVDVVEEEYRQDSIPHVSATDRRAVLARKYARLFRGTPYHHALAQGRESEGRKDDRVLLTAITRTEVLSPWLTPLLEHKVPVAGIYSLPVLSERLLKRIGAVGPNVLLISLQKASGLRQTFFRDGQLKISRLAHMPRLGSVPFADHLLGEVEKLRRYLNSLALISRDSPLSIYILSHGQLLTELEQHCHDSGNEKFVLLDVDQVATRVGLAEGGGTHFSDVMFARLLASEVPRNHYARAEETQYYTLHRLRLALAAASLLMVLGSGGWSGINFIEGVNFKQQALDATQKERFYGQRYELARAKLPPTPVEPAQIKTAVDAVATLREYKPDPTRLLSVLGAVLERAPQVTLDELEWMAGADADAPLVAEGHRREQHETVVASDGQYYQVAEMSAHLEPFDGDFRKAIAVVDGLASELKTMPQVKQVEVLQYPLDVRPEASLSGSATAAGARVVPAFKIRLVLGGKDGQAG